jgi:hypothetical protein
VRHPTRILTLAAVVPLTVLALAACTPGTQLPSVTRTSAGATPTPTATAAPGPAVSEIAALAQREVGEGTVTAVEDESDGSEWDVRVVLLDGAVRELHLAADGTVLAGPSADTTDANEESENRALVAAASVGLPSAQRRMLATVPGGRITAIELDDDEDRVVWRGDVLADGVRHDVRIDAVNGSVVLSKPDASPAPVPTSGS